jgi:hypothetical protein
VPGLIGQACSRSAKYAIQRHGGGNPSRDLGIMDIAVGANDHSCDDAYYCPHWFRHLRTGRLYAPPLRCNCGSRKANSLGDKDSPASPLSRERFLLYISSSSNAVMFAVQVLAAEQSAERINKNCKEVIWTMGEAPVPRVTYRVVPRKDSPVCDVHAIDEGGELRLVNTFNCEADAWQWVTEQEQASEICARLGKGDHHQP